jgi:hypothetical protein
MFTAWPAYAAFEEDIRGTIEPGKFADFTVFDRDIMRIPLEEIPQTRCSMTIIAGEPVFVSTNRQPTTAERASTTRSFSSRSTTHGGESAWLIR